MRLPISSHIVCCCYVHCDKHLLIHSISSIVTVVNDMKSRFPHRSSSMHKKSNKILTQLIAEVPYNNVIASIKNIIFLVKRRRAKVCIQEYV